MNVIYKGARMIKDIYNTLNPATLTGAIDILVIEQENEELQASPFHVRFGKLGVLRAKEKVVNITINDEEVDLHMKLGDQGEAFFVVEADDEQIPERLLTSPLPSRPVSPSQEGPNENTRDQRSSSRDETSVKPRKRRKRRKRRSISSPNDAGTDHSQSSDSEDDAITSNSQTLANIEQSLNSKQNHPIEPQLSIDIPGDDEATLKFERLCTVFSDSELPQGDEEGFTQESHGTFSDSEALSRCEVGTPVGWDWGELPSGKRQSLTVANLVKSRLVIEQEKRCPKPRTYSAPAAPTTSEDQDMSSKIGDPKKETKPSTPTPASREGSPKKKSRRPIDGLYLDEILDLEPNEANLYLSTKHDDKPADTQDSAIDDARSRTPEEILFGCSDAGVDSGTDCVISDDPCDPIDLSMPAMKMSLCGGKLEDGKLIVDEDKFHDKLVTYDQFMADPYGITQNSDLVIQLGERYCDWETAGPLFLSFCIFKQPITTEILERELLRQDKRNSKRAQATSGSRLSWLWRRGSQRDSISSTHSDQASVSAIKEKEESGQPANTPVKETLGKSLSTDPSIKQTRQSKTDESSSGDDEVATIASGRKDLKRAQTSQALFPQSPSKTMRKTTRLTSDQLKSLNLKPGANTVSFSVTSQYQGTSKCYATIFLWKWTDRLVVSDIDGTITKSDVFGQILPVVGKDWTQGGVAQLYDSISKNGYKFIYLSARAIGQAGMTKGYLNWINQQGVSLPPGPLFLSPTSLISAFRTEVIEKKPEKFKIQCLEDIKALFPADAQPLAAGFGNKKNDVVAYTEVGIPCRRVFTINPKGELKPEDMQTYTTSYSGLGDIVDNFFPAFDGKHCNFTDTQEFSTFNYWRQEMPDIVIDDLSS